MKIISEIFAYLIFYIFPILLIILYFGFTIVCVSGINKHCFEHNYIVLFITYFSILFSYKFFKSFTNNIYQKIILTIVVFYIIGLIFIDILVYEYFLFLAFLFLILLYLDKYKNDKCNLYKIDLAIIIFLIINAVLLDTYLKFEDELKYAKNHYYTINNVTNTSKQYIQANELYKQEKYNLAIKKFENIKDEPLIKYKLALSYFAIKDYNRTLFWLEKSAIEDNDSHSEYILSVNYLYKYLLENKNKMDKYDFNRLNNKLLQINFFVDDKILKEILYKNPMQKLIKFDFNEFYNYIDSSAKQGSFIAQLVFILSADYAKATFSNDKNQDLSIKYKWTISALTQYSMPQIYLSLSDDPLSGVYFEKNKIHINNSLNIFKSYYLTRKAFYLADFNKNKD